MAKLFSIRSVLTGTVVAVAAAAGWWLYQNRDVSPSEYHQTGSMGPVEHWPLIPIHAIILPDGRVMSYGTHADGKQGGDFNYDVWTPSKGLADKTAHLTLPNKTGTDIFCAGQVIVPFDDSVLLVGGDRTVNGVRNYSSADINFFDYKKNEMTPATGQRTMQYPRWYPTVVTMPNGDILVSGGRLDLEHYVSDIELYSPGKGWKTLNGARSAAAFGEPNWIYPMSWVTPTGKVFILSITGETFMVDTAGEGHIETTSLRVPSGIFYLPAVMYSPGKILTLRAWGRAGVVDINGAQPTYTPTSRHGLGGRINAFATVLPDGKVFLSGGGVRVINRLNKDFLVNYATALWDPKTGQWTHGPRTGRMRLYHSISLLLPDATVLVAGGGAPGPQTNTNAEIYYPPYLYKQDGSGTLVDKRPQILEAPTFMSWGKDIQVKTDGADVSRVTLVHAGSVTHTMNFDQRMFDLGFKADGASLNVTPPGSANVAPPGYYMLFVFDKAGVPSMAKLIKLG